MDKEQASITVSRDFQQKLLRIANQNHRSVPKQLAVIVEEWEKTFDKSK